MRKMINHFAKSTFWLIPLSFLLLMASCDNKAENPVEKNESEINLEAIKESAAKIEGVLLDQDRTGISDFMFEDAKVIHGKNGEKYSDEQLKEIGEAFALRELTHATEDMAVYTFPLNGQEFMLIMGKVNEYEWKIVHY